MGVCGREEGVQVVEEQQVKFNAVRAHQDGAVRARWDDASEFSAVQDQRSSAGSIGWLSSSLNKDDAVCVFSRRRLLELKLSKMMRFKFKKEEAVAEIAQ